MTPDSPDPLTRLAALLESDPAVSGVELTEFPSGGAMLDARCQDGRAFVLAASPAHGYAVDEVQADEGFTTGYKHSYADFESAERKLKELIFNESGDRVVALNLVVIQAHDLEASREFYANLGLAFRAEQHGEGAQHYAAVIGQTVFEVYPRNNGAAAGQLRLGFKIKFLPDTLRLLRAQAATIVREVHDSPWGRRAIVQDPDGNRVELTEMPGHVVR
jgi:lactoylglutathione lyase